MNNKSNNEFMKSGEKALGLQLDKIKELIDKECAKPKPIFNKDIAKLETLLEEARIKWTDRLWEISQRFRVIQDMQPDKISDWNLMGHADDEIADGWRHRFYCLLCQLPNIDQDLLDYELGKMEHEMLMPGLASVFLYKFLDEPSLTPRERGFYQFVERFAEEHDMDECCEFNSKIEQGLIELQNKNAKINWGKVANPPLTNQQKLIRNMANGFKKLLQATILQGELKKAEEMGVTLSTDTQNHANGFIKAAYKTDGERQGVSHKGEK